MTILGLQGSNSKIQHLITNTITLHNNVKLLYTLIVHFWKRQQINQHIPVF